MTIRTRLAAMERFGRDIQGIRPLLKRFEGRCEVFRSSDFEPDNFKSERAGRSLDLVHLEDRRGIIGVAHDRQPAKVGDNLAEEIETLATEIAGLARQACEIAARARQILRDQPAAERLCSAVPQLSTIGIAEVASFTAPAAVPDVRITSTLRRTNSAAIAA